MSTFANYRMSTHAECVIAERGIPRHVIDEILANPGQMITDGDRRNCYQSLYTRAALSENDENLCLIRVITDADPVLPLVITVFLTNNVDHFWQPQPDPGHEQEDQNGAND